jgi:hypothetical protein
VWREEVLWDNDALHRICDRNELEVVVVEMAHVPSFFLNDEGHCGRDNPEEIVLHTLLL